jgi:hypothetical protein
MSVMMMRRMAEIMLSSFPAGGIPFSTSQYLNCSDSIRPTAYPLGVPSNTKKFFGRRLIFENWSGEETGVERIKEENRI